MNKIKNFMNKPITWGGYLKFTAICTVVSAAVCAAEMAVLTGFSPFKAKKSKIEEDENDYEY